MLDCLDKSALARIVAPTFAPSPADPGHMVSQADEHMEGEGIIFPPAKNPKWQPKTRSTPPDVGYPHHTPHTHISERGEIYPLLPVCQKSGKTQLNNTKHNH